MDSIESMRCAQMADAIADEVELTPRLYDAFCEVPRGRFVGGRDPYSLAAHPIGGEQWISSPLTVAKMTLALEAENCDNILEIGCGSGYQAAILARLAHRIFSVERVENLATSAKERLAALGVRNVFVRYDDGNGGWRGYAPYDRILLSCACVSVPEGLFRQLKDGGILVAPVGNEHGQVITKYVKNGENISETRLDNCDFVPLLKGRA